ncbi:hypothetical protein AC579_860 [Pseudocercospora musae]|uniref:Uncharacterized protein n=1 Tax=Pseudocercospora musae TaxID=113226 RepID=A0A139HI12_9PEZI|nr:hypothetical protein AC579_860 [Pseudocercospora musae]KXT02116.1 hypothetical protein AC579_860 [Pseudocercospora musae]
MDPFSSTERSDPSAPIAYSSPSLLHRQSQSHTMSETITRSLLCKKMPKPPAAICSGYDQVSSLAAHSAQRNGRQSQHPSLLWSAVRASHLLRGLAKLHDHMDSGKKCNATDTSAPEHIQFVSRSIDLIIAFKRAAASLNLQKRDYPVKQHAPDKYDSLFIWGLRFANRNSPIQPMISLVHMVSSKLRLRQFGVLPRPSEGFCAEGHELSKNTERDGYYVFCYLVVMWSEPCWACCLEHQAHGTSTCA